jgi:hypothetical protein
MIRIIAPLPLAECATRLSEGIAGVRVPSVISGTVSGSTFELCTGQTFIVLWATSIVAVMIFCFIFGTASHPIGLVIAAVVLLALAVFLLLVLRAAARPQTAVILSFLERELECRKL